MYRIPTEPDTTPTPLFNPTKEDFHDQIAETAGPRELILPSQKISYFPKYVADHIAKHLARKLALADDPKRDFEIRYQEQLTKICVKLETYEPQ